MGVGVAGGFRDIGAAAMGYIPEVWAGKLLVKFYLSTVFGAIANTDYEGDIVAQGDKVNIRTLPDITINDHLKGQVLDYEQPESAPVTLDVDSGKSWSFVGDRIDLAQTDIKNYIEQWSQDAAQQMKIKIDKDILDTVFSSADANNQGATAGKISGDIDLGVTGTPRSVTKVDIVEVLTECGQVLDENDVPEDGRWIVLPAWTVNLLKNSDLKDASLAGDAQSILRNGKVGMIDRFTVYQSNQVNSVTDGPDTVYNVIFGTNHAITFASQLVENESLPNPTGFGTLHRGLQVYGFDVIKPQSLGLLYVTKG